MFSIGLRGPQWSCDPTTNGFEGSGQESDYITNQSGEVVTKTTMDEGVMTWDYTNVYADGQLFATYDAQGLHFQLNDWLGTRRVTTDYAGVVEETCASLPYGSGLSCSGSEYAPNEQHFTGKTHDAESGLDYFGARYYSENDARFLSPDWSAKVEPVPYAKMDDPQSLNLYGYMLDSPLDGVDQDGHSTLVFDGKTHTITLYSKSGTKLGTYPAYNNVDSHASIGKLVNGTYPMLDTTSPHLHPGPEGKENGAIGPGGIYRMKRFKGADGKPHSGVGVHAGRATKPDLAGRSGPAHATEGCIRTNDAGIAKITATVKTDPLTSTTVENNRTPKPPRNLTSNR